MRILITGTLLFVIWAFFSAWMYNDVLLPVINKPVVVQTIPVPPDPVADSLAKILASTPKQLLIYFDFDKIKIKTDQQAENSISEFKTWLEKYSNAMVSVTGHSDLVGTTEYNQELALKRARVIVKYLEGQGISPERIMSEAKGETDPVADYLTAAGRAKNRRTEISIKMH